MLNHNGKERIGLRSEKNAPKTLASAIRENPTLFFNNNAEILIIRKLMTRLSISAYSTTISTNLLYFN